MQEKVIIFMTGLHVLYILHGKDYVEGAIVITIDYGCEKILDYTISFVWERYGRWSPQKSYFDLLSLFHIELQHTNSLRACHRDCWI